MPIEDAQALIKLYEKIEDRNVALGFFEALLVLPRIPGVSVEPESHGYMSSLRVRRGSEWCFSLAPAQKWLLGYIARPEIDAGRLDLAKVQKRLPEAIEKPNREIKVRLQSFEEITQFIALIKGA